MTSIIKWALPLLLCASCATHPTETAPETPNLQASSSWWTLRQDTSGRTGSTHRGQTHEEAQLRAKQVAHPTYMLWFGLDSRGEQYDGRAILNFELRTKQKDLSKFLAIDFEGGTVRSVKVNDALLPLPQYDGYQIKLRTQDLVPGANRVEITFGHPYASDGTGLHRFEDPVDHRVYLYSNSEPFFAHRIFPCFDQPDLKASFELTVEAPEDWQVIANTLEREVNHVDGRNSWAFPPSPLLSTYVFSLAGGPFHVWKSTADGIPLRLFARESLATDLAPDKSEWLEITAKGLDYFSVLFGYPYPYSKYDQVVVPDFNGGGMENAGAVTFSERAIHRSPTTREQHRRRAETILHEMAHMWFGDLVTMHWWNGLWLKESFATYMAMRATEEATTFKGSWLDFFSRSKTAAIEEDEWVTSHPVEAPVPNSEVATARFDAITYGKGAALLRQLSYYLGDDDFKEGIQRYFQKYALKNTTLNDFFKMLGEASGKDLGPWHRAWFQSPGINTLEAKWSCQDDKIDHFVLLQGNEEGQPKLLRPHRTRIALYRFPKKGRKLLKVYEKTDVQYVSAETPVTSLIGKECPSFVFPNDEDLDYAKVSLDPVSLEWVQKKPPQFEDPLVNRMVWGLLWKRVRDGKLRAQEYADLVFQNGNTESDPALLRSLLQTLIQVDLAEDSVYKYLPPTEQKDFLSKCSEFFRKGFLAAPPASDLQLTWYRAFLQGAWDEAAPQSIQLIQRFLAGKARLRGFEVDQDRRWEMIEALARNNSPGIRDLIGEEFKKDSSDRGSRYAIACEVSLPDPETRKTWLAKIHSPFQGSQPVAVASGVPGAKSPILDKTLSISELKSAMRNFQRIRQEDFARLSMDSYFATVPRLIDPSLEIFARNYADAMFPALCDSDVVLRTKQLLDHNPGLPAYILKTLKEHRQQEELCIRAKEKSAHK